MRAMSSPTGAAPARQRNCGCAAPPLDKPLIPEYRYGTAALLGQFLGVNAAPKRIDFLCPACRRVVASLTERAELARYVRTY